MNSAAAKGNRGKSELLVVRPTRARPVAELPQEDAREVSAHLDRCNSSRRGTNLRQLYQFIVKVTYS